ncbi:IQ domain-containing protein C [Myxocyprinus asiaticus]|uniref:IQ domain-containing protein C n=1 Tax=Myxocyprinus asiaticus TaxID=70543 RepID=UPI002222222B|nr:IQ domain-containing protein C [Myxocyprinus asiaticus]
MFHSGAMNQQQWIQKLTHFQAYCRGYLMRKDLSSVRTQFEDIVREIDGNLDHLLWRGNIIPKPHFTDTKSLLLKYGCSRNQCNDHLDDSAKEQKVDYEDSKSVLRSEVLVPERDEAPKTAGAEASTLLDGDVEQRDNLTDDFTTLCSAVNPDISHSSLLQKGTHVHSVFKDGAHTADSLRQQRSALAMELLWIQQAIRSRKKYLTLKQRMDVSH